MKYNVIEERAPVVDIPDFMAIHNEPEQERSKEVAANSGKLPPLIKSEKIMIAVLCICQLICTMTFSILSIFYPDAAYNKGLNAEDVSYVFAAFFLGAFLFSPGIGILITKKGTKTVMVISLFISAITVLLFAFTDYFHWNDSFLLSCIILRFLQGISFVGVQTSCFTIISHQFETRVGFLTGILEMCSGIAYSFSNPLGGFLYQYGGYSAPFFTLFGLAILATILCWWFIPSSNAHLESSIPLSKTLSLLKAPRIYFGIIPALIMFIQQSVFVTYGALFMKMSLKKSDTIIGLILSSNSVSYAVLTPIMGVIVDKWGFIRSPLAVGLCIRGFGFLILGSSVIFGFKMTLSTGIIAVMVMGIGLVGGLVPIFKYILLQARDSGFESNFHTSSMVATLLSTVQSVGSFIGPLLGGQIIEQVGFQICFIIFGFFTISASLVILADCIRVKLCSSKPADRENQDERAPLVINDSSP